MNPTEPISAPNLPDAAEIPLQLPRIFVGNNSEGRMKVIALGPKLAKKNVRHYNTINYPT